MATALLAGCDRQDAETSSATAPATARPSVTSTSANMGGPPWVVDPTEPGPDLPPTGRSLFDFLVTNEQGGKKVYEVPFPFPALLDHIDRQLGVKVPPSPLKRLLIPVNRSLQRRASDGEFFAYPRAVVAVDTEADSSVGSSGMLLKDRLFIGYHEKANVLEVISYNEVAGRFEFQVVKDYRAGGTPSVRYANRTLCTACHQNQSPIFSRPLWEETNANPKVAALLAAQHREFHGFPVHQGVGVPQAFDEATDRANEFALTQLLWRDGCEEAGPPERSMACRADLTRWLLRYLLSGGRLSDWRTTSGDKDMTPSFLAAWRARWPQGLAIPDPDLPNRNPFRFVPLQEFPGLSSVEASALEGLEERSSLRGMHEPTLRREPLEVWSVPTTPQELERVLAGFAQFVTGGDIERLDRLLREQAAPTIRTSQFTAACRVEVTRLDSSRRRGRFSCGPSDQSRLLRGRSPRERELTVEAVLEFNGPTFQSGVIETLVFPDGELLARVPIISRSLITRAGKVVATLSATDSSGRRHARRATGEDIREVQMEWPTVLREGRPIEGFIVLSVRDDVAPLQQALAALVRKTAEGRTDVCARQPFRRARLFEALDEELQAPPLRRCCLDDGDLPPAVSEAAIEAHESIGVPPEEPPVGALNTFHRYCGACHHGDDEFPPNFLHGSPAQVETNLRRCADRILVRLAIWHLPGTDRIEAPMPPANYVLHVLQHGIGLDQWVTHRDFRTLRDYAAEAVQERRGNAFDLQDLLRQDYDTLPACVVPRAQTG